MPITIPTYIPKWDSFKLHIPLERCRRLDKGIIDIPLTTFRTDTGEFIEENFIKLDQVDYFKGITFKANKTYAVTGGNNAGEWRLSLQVNSKKLKSGYFEGITIDNIREIYDYIISKDLFYIEFEDFLSGYVYDADVCLDFEATPETFDKLCSELWQCINPTHYKICERFSKWNNKGVEFGKRDKSTLQKPYVKIYHKGLELLHKANKNNDVIGEFNKEFLGNSMYNIGRLELTLKGRKHYEALGLLVDGRPIHTLRELLEFDKEKLLSIVKSVVREKYIQKRMNNNFSEDNVSPKDKMLLACFDYIIGVGEDEDWFIKMAKDNGSSDTQKHRNVKLVKKLLEDVRFKERLVENQRSRGVAHKLGQQLGFWE